MRSVFFLIAVTIFSACSTNSPMSSRETMQADVDQAAAIIERFEAIPESGIPPAVMRAAKGLAILNVTRAGFIGSVRGGTGVVVARTNNSWSGPSAIATGGLRVGFQAGADVSEFVIVLNTPEAVNAFAKRGNFILCGSLGVAAGPVLPWVRPCILTAGAKDYSRGYRLKEPSSARETRSTRRITASSSTPRHSFREGGATGRRR